MNKKKEYGFFVDDYKTSVENQHRPTWFINMLDELNLFCMYHPGVDATVMRDVKEVEIRLIEPPNKQVILETNTDELYSCIAKTWEDFFKTLLAKKT